MVSRNSAIHIFIKHVSAVAAYIRLTGRSQGNISQQRISRPILFSAAPAPLLQAPTPGPHLNSRLTSGKSRSTLCNHLPSQAGFYIWQRSLKKAEYSRQSVPGKWRFSLLSLVRKWLYSDFGIAVRPVLTRWRTHMTSVHLLENQHQSFPNVRPFCKKRDNQEHCQQCRFNDGDHECSRQTPCVVSESWLTENWDAHKKVPEAQEKSRRSIQKVAGSNGQ